MSSAAERFAKRMPEHSKVQSMLPKEGQPAMSITAPRPARSRRSRVLNTTLSDEAFSLLEQITLFQRTEGGKGRSWRHNATIEASLRTLAAQLGLSLKA